MFVATALTGCGPTADDDSADDDSAT
jgi:hypothetical protein